MNIILQDLLELQTLEFGEATGKNIEARVAALRAKLPPPIVGHYDRLRVRGRKGMAMVRNQVCTGCHMRVPIGTITELMRGEDIQLCESCARYLYLPDSAKTEVKKPEETAKPKAKAKVKAPAKPRKRRSVTSAA